MKIVIFESDAVHAAHIMHILCLSDEKPEIVLNPSVRAQLGSGDDLDKTLFLVDTRYKAVGENFLTLARKIRENSEICHICFMSPSPGDIGFCYKKLVRPSAFLLKPVDSLDLRALISEINSYCAVKKSNSDDPQILLKTRDSRLLLHISSILYFTTLEKKVLCYTQSNGSISFYGTLASLESRYKDYFLRCHSGFLVNRQKINNFSKSAMTLKIHGTETEIPVSKSRVRAVESFIESMSSEKLKNIK